MLDYILNVNVAVAISAGVGALVSAMPALHDHALCLGILALIAIVNLRGVRESSVAFGIPTYIFVAAISAVLIIGIVKTITAGGHPVPVAASPPLAPAAATCTVPV